MNVYVIAPRSFASNCYIAVSGNQALVIDPSASVRAILGALHEHEATCVGIVLTHGHFDHMLSLDALRDALPGVPVYLHAADSDFLSDGQKNAFSLFYGEPRTWHPASHLLADGDVIALGEEHVHILHTPGHTPGSICLYSGDLLLTGDTLFDGSYGRCDLYGGSIRALEHSLARLTALDENIRIYPGHGSNAPLGSALRATGLIGTEQ